MPLRTIGDFLIEPLGNGQKDVFQTVIEGMQNRSHGRHLDQIGRILLSPFPQLCIRGKELVDLTDLERDLRGNFLSQLAGALLPVASTGRMSLAYQD